MIDNPITFQHTVLVTVLLVTCYDTSDELRRMCYTYDVFLGHMQRNYIVWIFMYDKLPQPICLYNTNTTDNNMYIWCGCTNMTELTFIFVVYRLTSYHMIYDIMHNYTYHFQSCIDSWISLTGDSWHTDRTTDDDDSAVYVVGSSQVPVLMKLKVGLLFLIWLPHLYFSSYYT